MHYRFITDIKFLGFQGNQRSFTDVSQRLLKWCFCSESIFEKQVRWIIIISQKLFSHWILIYSRSEIVVIRKLHPLIYCFIKVTALESDQGSNLKSVRNFCFPYLCDINLSGLRFTGVLNISGNNSHNNIVLLL